MATWITDGKELIGLILAVIALGGAVAGWFWKRVSANVATNVSGLTSGHAAIQRRLDEVEKDQARLGEDMKAVELRLSRVENRLGSLATKSDVNALAISMAELKVTGAQTAQMVDTLYRGVVDRAERGR